ncbi:MAG: hypothetical protein RBJ76_09405 [Stenomitos frigidus ULC029]
MKRSPAEGCLFTIDNIQRLQSAEVGKNTTQMDEITEAIADILLLSALTFNFAIALVIRASCCRAF